jgi:hypothetical protein
MPQSKKPACRFATARYYQIEEAVALIRKAAENMSKEADSKDIDLEEQENKLLMVADRLEKENTL